MSTRLTALDATFLELEEADDSAHMHIGAIMVFEATPHGGPPTLEALGAHLKRRLARLPRYGERLSHAHTGGLSWPEWERDPDFEVARHLSRAALPAPGGDAELHEWSAAFFSLRLDRRRPLWEMVIVEGLADGRWALATKTHHCMVDGISAVDVGYLLLDADAEGSAGADAPGTPGEDEDSGGAHPTGLARAFTALAPLGTLAQAAQKSVRGALHPRETLGSARAAIDMIVREELHGAPATSLNEPIGTLRRFDVVRAPLEDLKQIRSALGGTVNDVAIAVVASGMRRLLVERGEELPDDGLRAMVPMNIRADDEHLALGNRVSSLFVELPVASPDAGRRYRETVVRSRALKHDGHQAEGSTTVIELAGLAPPVLHATIAQALYATRLFNVTITNVPGPQRRLYVLGAPLREIHPLVPLAACHALGVAVVSYDGMVFFGVVADRDSVPDLGVLTAAMSDALDELRVLSGIGSERVGAPAGERHAARAAAMA